MATMKTPGVYIVEKNAFPNAVVEVATAVPAFIGYTEIADHQGTSLAHRPWRIGSLAEFHQFFGGPPEARFEIRARAQSAAEPAAFALGDRAFDLARCDGTEHGRFILCRCMQLFFQNGGASCYIVSVGDYTASAVDATALIQGIEALVRAQEPTLVVVPDAVLLPEPDCIAVQQAALVHCGATMRNRFAILDLWGGWRSRQDGADCVSDFRAHLGVDHLAFAAAYYPWVRTTVVQEGELGCTNISNPQQLQFLLRQEAGLDPGPASPTPEQAARLETIDDIGRTLDDGTVADTRSADANQRSNAQRTMAQLNNALVATSPMFAALRSAMCRQLNLLPPSAAMAGVYTMVDTTRGVWKAPANVGLAGVAAPSVALTSEDQQDLNVTAEGKSINAIRAFIGEGVRVWGARTLDGNSLDWRYVNVRRSMLMIEESCRLATRAMVFELNAPETWVTVESMLVNFLTGIWKRGGLAGATPDDAFSVHVGLGQTMTLDDVLEGILRVTVLVALSRPAEFIEISFQQQMQKS